MAVIGDGEGRVRAWIMIQVNAPVKAARKLYNSHGLEGGDSYVVVRADVVDYVYNVVIPVDAANLEVLQAVHQMILDITGAKASVVIPVVQPVPHIPHDAEGFVTAAEYAKGHEKVHCKVGRQRWSPGMNAWG
jgi:hypothetical protein